MTYVTASVFAKPDPTDFFHRAINAMVNFGWDMLGRIRGVAVGGSFDHLPKRWRDPKRSEQRLSHTLDWIFGLARTLAGDSFYLPQPQRPESANPRPAGTQARPKPAQQRSDLAREQQRAAAQLRYMRKIFATQPTNRIAKRLARRLGTKEGTDWWPEELLTITETPAAWAARTFGQAASEPPPPTQPPDPLPPHPATQDHQPEVAFHPRE